MTLPLWILSTQRTGTTMLMSILNQTKQFNPKINEYLNLNVATWMRDDPPRNCKVFCDQFKRQYGDHKFGRVEEAYPMVRWVSLFRRDLAAQTVSYLLSADTKVWNVGANATSLEKYHRVSAEWNDERVLRLARWLVYCDKEITRFLRTRSHIRIAYEDLQRTPLRLANTVMKFCEAQGSATSQSHTVKLHHPGKVKATERVRQILESAGIRRA